MHLASVRSVLIAVLLATIGDGCSATLVTPGVPDQTGTSINRIFCVATNAGPSPISVTATLLAGSGRVATTESFPTLQPGASDQIDTFASGTGPYSCRFQVSSRTSFRGAIAATDPTGTVHALAPAR